MECTYERKFERYKYVCPNCFNTVKNCTCICYPETLIQIDKNILPIVKILNEKCYYTFGSCEGHIGTNEIIYIIFKKNFKFKKSPPTFYEYKSGVIKATISGMSELSKARNKNKMLKSLLEWAESL